MDAIYNLLNPWDEKMVHEIPTGKVVNRAKFILEKCKGKRVINFGSSGSELQEALKIVASDVSGIDREGHPDFVIDLDDEHYTLAHLPIADVFVCGEILEHLLAPGIFLKRLKFHMKHHASDGAELIVTAPNAFGSAANNWAVGKHVECVNNDHVAWYSYQTLKTLLEKCEFKVKEFYWYKGKPITAEGLVFVAN